jgi:intracellular sulfur oxidation DsrE/DsrF family protein
MRSSRPFVVPLILLGLMVAQALADDEGKPFAEARIVLQMADGDAESQTRVLNVANNLIKHYGGPDFVDIEIVAYGPGLSLLYPGNANEERISSLLANDVRFVSCMNTVESRAGAAGLCCYPALTNARPYSFGLLGELECCRDSLDTGLRTGMVCLARGSARYADPRHCGTRYRYRYAPADHERVTDESCARLRGVRRRIFGEAERIGPKADGRPCFTHRRIRRVRSGKAVAQDHLGNSHAVNHGNRNLVALVPAILESRLRHLERGIGGQRPKFDQGRFVRYCGQG